MHRLTAVSVLFVFSSTAFAATDTGLLALVPAEAKIVSSIDVQEARHSPFGQFLLSKMNSEGDGFDKMVRETGFDPRRDLASFIFASAGPSTPNGEPRFVVLARGTFDPQAIRNHILAAGATVQKVAGVEVLVGDHHGAQPQAFALPDSDIAVFGDLASVKEVIANRANPPTFDAALQSLISNISANNDAWFASTLAGTYLARHVSDATNQQAKAQAQALQSVRQAAGGVQFGDSVKLTFDAITRSPQDAVALEDVVRFMASFVQIERQNDPHAAEWASVVDAMTMNASGDHFQASIAIPEKILEQLADSETTSSPHHGFKSAKPSQQ